MPEKKIISNESGSLVLEVSEDGFSAYLTIKDSGQMIDENEITSLLNVAGIRTGVDEAVLYNRQQKTKKELNKSFLIAFKTKSKSQFLPFVKKEFSASPSSLMKLKKIHLIILSLFSN